MTAGGFDEAGAGFLSAADADALSGLRAAIAIQAEADPRLGLIARHLLFRYRDDPAGFDRAEAALVGLAAFERTLVERHPEPRVDAARRALLACLDALARNAPPSVGES